MKRIIIEQCDAGGRLDKFLGRLLPGAGRSFLYKMLRKKNITLNGRKADGSELTAEGDEVCVYFSDETFAAFSAVQQDTGIRTGDFCRIVYEDENIILADKYSGVLSQKSRPEDRSLNEALADYDRRKHGMDQKQYETGFRPSVCNRLDRNTGGLVTFARNYASAAALNRMFAERTAEKYYLAMVSGRPDNGIVRRYLVKDAAINKVTLFRNQQEIPACLRKEAACIETEIRNLASQQDAAVGLITLIRVRLITGKTHQIRATMAELGTPILGDVKYGNPRLNTQLKKQYQITSQMLHAFELSMPDPTPAPLGYLSGRSFRTGIPEDFMKFQSILHKAGL